MKFYITYISFKIGHRETKKAFPGHHRQVDLNVSKNTSIKDGMSASGVGGNQDGGSKLKITDENTLT